MKKKIKRQREELTWFDLRDLHLQEKAFNGFIFTTKLCVLQ